MDLVGILCWKESMIDITATIVETALVCAARVTTPDRALASAGTWVEFRAVEMLLGA